AADEDAAVAAAGQRISASNHLLAIILFFADGDDFFTPKNHSIMLDQRRLEKEDKGN
ncbi:unnamed protein product, partial [Pylaiella littoralis]